MSIQRAQNKKPVSETPHVKIHDEANRLNIVPDDKEEIAFGGASNTAYAIGPFMFKNGLKIVDRTGKIVDRKTYVELKNKEWSGVQEEMGQ